MSPLNKFIKFGFILTLPFLMHSCLKKNKIEESNSEIAYSKVSYSLEDLTELDLEVFAMSPEIVPILDSAIDLTINCESYKNIQFSFAIESYKDSLDTHRFHISTLSEPYKLNYNYCQGISFYKGYRIVLIGGAISDHFSSLGFKETIFFISPEKKEHIDPKYGEFFDSSWDYIYEDGRFICYHYNYCGDFWYDESFYPGED